MTTPSQPPFTTIGRYQIQSLLGRGGMGEVYKAFDPGLDRTVALKTIRADADSPSYLDRLYREAKACGRLHHPRIVTVFDIGEAEGVVFIAMEYLEGENLSAAMARGDLGFELKVTILIQILEALQYAHSEGVIHRDIKPANVHVLPDRSVKLVDFGLARVTRADSLTMSGAIMGTPYYMSPEQLKGAKVDGRSDVYSTGVLAYELFTRRRAFEGDSITTVMLKVLSEMPPPMQTAWSATFPDIERIVSRAIAKSADDRYPTAEDMKNALTAFLASSHDAITRSQADVTIQSQRAVIEAKTLIAQGEHARSEAILAETLRLDPDAKEARALWDQATQTMPVPPPVVAAPPKAVMAEPPLAPPVVKPPTAPPVGARPAVAPTVRVPQPPVVQSRETPRSRRGLWLTLGAAALGTVGVIAFVAVNGLHGVTPTGSSAASTTAAAAAPSATPAIATSSPGSPGSPAAVAPAASQAPAAVTQPPGAASTPAAAQLSQAPAPAGRARDIDYCGGRQPRGADRCGRHGRGDDDRAHQCAQDARRGRSRC